MIRINSKMVLFSLFLTVLALVAAADTPRPVITLSLDMPDASAQGNMITVNCGVTNSGAERVRLRVEMFVYYKCPVDRGYLYGCESIVDEKPQRITLEPGETFNHEVSFVTPAPDPCDQWEVGLWVTAPHTVFNVKRLFTVH